MLVAVTCLIVTPRADADGTDGGSPTIVSKPMPSDCHRRRTGAVIDTVMIHSVSDVVARPHDPFDVDRIVAIFRESRVSAHYLIDRVGRIHRLVDESQAAFHAGRGRHPHRDRPGRDLNDTSIGIELLGIGTADEMRRFIDRDTYERIPSSHLGFTDRQYESCRRLLVDLAARHPGIELDRRHVIGHDEYAPGRKVDPGSLFDWTKLGLTSVVDRDPRP